MVDIVSVTDQPALERTAAQRIVELIDEIHSTPTGGVSGDGLVRLVITGGSAGIGTLAALRTADIDWSRVHIFFGDDRNVPVSHPDSNEGQARDALFSLVDIPEDNIHGMGLTGSDDMDKLAEAYENVLATFAPDGFDLHLLGMGPEGHINTLFPHTEAVQEQLQLVIPIYDSPKPPPQRLTLTLPAVARAERVWLLVAGADKAEAAAAVAKEANPVEWPAAGAHGSKETLLFLADDAAGLIK